MKSEKLKTKNNQISNLRFHREYIRKLEVKQLNLNFKPNLPKYYLKFKLFYIIRLNHMKNYI